MSATSNWGWTEDHELVGKTGAVPKLTGRGRWWIKIEKVCLQNGKPMAAKVSAGRAFGHPKVVAVSTIQFK